MWCRGLRRVTAGSTWRWIAGIPLPDRAHLSSHFGQMRLYGTHPSRTRFVNKAPGRVPHHMETDSMAVRVTKGILKASDLHESPEDHHAHKEEEQRPRNMPPNTFPTEGFSVEVDGKIKSQHATSEAALKAGT